MGKFVLAQLEQNGHPSENLIKASKIVAEAKDKYQPDVIVFPERFMSHYPLATDLAIQVKEAQTLDGPFVSGMKRLAREYGVWLIFGMSERSEKEIQIPDVASDQDEVVCKYCNSVVALNSDGEVVSVYRKTHLYDAFGNMESDMVEAGDELFCPIDTPFGKLGLFVCYEVRFPEVARDQAMKGADIIVMPTAWVKGPHKSEHFRTLITARAIENTVFMVACDQCGVDCIGESVVVDPMGIVLASAGTGEEILTVDIDLDRISEVRKTLPSVKNRRPELY